MCRIRECVIRVCKRGRECASSVYEQSERRQTERQTTFRNIITIITEPTDYMPHRTLWFYVLACKKRNQCSPGLRRLRLQVGTGLPQLLKIGKTGLLVR